MLPGLVRTRAGTIPDRRMVSAAARGPTKDEEHGKRDDDFRPRMQTSTSASWLTPWKWRRRRLVIGLLVVVAVWQLFSSVPSLEPLRPLTGYAFSAHDPIGPPPVPVPIPADDAPARAEDRGGDQYYSGKIHYSALFDSFKGVPRAVFGEESGNVLYVASSLQSAANLIPMACEMGRAGKNKVHMAFVGRNALPLAEILAVNGADPTFCKVGFHDARPDYPEYSTERRAELSVLSAMRYLNEHLNPHAWIVDDSSVEDPFFTKAVRQRATDFNKPLIVVPEKKYDEFLWMTRLDAHSLENWYRPTVDILIQAPRQSAGSLVRLLKSLGRAEYAGLKFPRLTIELPPQIDPVLAQWVKDLQWPPAELAEPSQTSLLAVHHRIATQNLNSEQASLRFVESFYPSDPQTHHVLVLSPQAELHPLFLQQLHYHILHYRYSADAWASSDLMGISLERATSFVNGASGLQDATVADMQQSPLLKNSDPLTKAPFLYQAPSSGASLVFGDKWATFHDFLRRRVTAIRAGLSKKQSKQVSEAEPAWMEYLLELMRARGWSMLHPAAGVVTIHNELAQVPEEFSRPPPPGEKKTLDPLKSPSRHEAYLTAEEPPALPIRKEVTAPALGANVPLHKTLPFDGHLPELGALPYLTHAGKSHLRIAVNELTSAYVPWFMTEIGGCDAATAKSQRVAQEYQTDDLFCLPADQASVELDDEEPPARPASPARKAQPGGGAGPAVDVVLPEMERQSLKMLDSPEVEIGWPSDRRPAAGGFKDRPPAQFRGIQAAPPAAGAI